MAAMSATNFNTKNDTFRKLMGNGLTYRIPRFQRDYSWSEDEWEDLWLDILGTIGEGGEPAHYMGYLVLQSDNDKVFDVIDGQQRLTTLTLIVLAVLRNLQRLVEDGKDAERNAARATQIRQTYIGYLDPVTLVARSKLSLNRNNDAYFQTYLVPLGHLPQRGFSASVHGLRKAFEWFDRRIRDHARKGGPDEGVTLASLVETMSDRLFFTVITVTDELNAYKVFETLNARGVRLSATDLLKNYLFSVLARDGRDEAEMTTLEDRWEAMVGRLGAESFPDFLRTHWNSRNGFVRQTDLFKTIRGSVAAREKVFELIRGMEEDMDTYLGLTRPEASGWPQSVRGLASDLRMFNVRQPFPLLLAARRTFDDADFETLLRACVTISFRYNVIGSQLTSEQERVYNRVAGGLSRGETVSAAEALAGMATIYPDDDQFRASFVRKSIRTTQSRNGRVVRYILARLELQFNGQALDADSDAMTIEHVLPQHPAAGWDAFDDEEAEAMAYRLGNMTLLHRSANHRAGDGDYAAKRPLYTASPIGLTRKLAEDNAEWTPARIEARQQWMAGLATSIWRVGQLSRA